MKIYALIYYCWECSGQTLSVHSTVERAQAAMQKNIEQALEEHKQSPVWGIYNMAKEEQEPKIQAELKNLNAHYSIESFTLDSDEDIS